MSRETAEARFVARSAERDWREHHHGCPRCARAVRARQWDDLCPHGAEFRVLHQQAARELAENRRLDKLPSPDQGVLFGPGG
jgi:hypothetical protein